MKSLKILKLRGDKLSFYSKKTLFHYDLFHYENDIIVD